MLIAVVLLGILVNVLLIWAVMRRVANEKRAVLARLTKFLTADGDKSSELAQTIDIISQRLGASMATSLSASFLQTKSVDARMDKRMEQAVALDSAAQMPGWMGLLAQMPQVRALIKGNPGYVAKAQQMFAGMKAEPESENGGQEAFGLDSF